MRCSKCQVNVDHDTSYSFVLDKKVLIYCDACYEAYLKVKRQAVLKARRSRGKKPA